MAKVLPLSTLPPLDEGNPAAMHEYNRFMKAVAADRWGIHQAVDDPADADIMLFICSIRPDMKDILKHPIARAYPESSFAFHLGDRMVPSLPGVYTSIEKPWYDTSRTRTGHFMRVFEMDHLVPDDDYGPEPHLASFAGRPQTHPIRQALFDLKDPRIFLRTSLPPSDSDETYRRTYRELLRTSLFALCPRGFGASSVRLFEAMRMSRCPVILADEWTPPQGPDWEAFSLIVPYGELPALPELLREREANAVELGRMARKVWDDWFSLESTFHRVTEWCLDIQTARRRPEWLARRALQLKKFRPVHLRESLAHRFNRGSA